MRRALWMFVTLLVWPHESEAGDFDLSGFTGTELRIFVEAPQFPEQFSGPQPSFFTSPEFRYRSDEGRDQFSLVPFFRLDARDDERTHFDLREAYWLRLHENWEVLVGFNRVFWGVTESRHLVDIINQIDAVEDIDEEDKLGQPMINVAAQQDWGRLSFYVLPGFRERKFPGSAGRLRPAPPVDDDAAEFESNAKKKHVDFALRYSHFVGNWDLGAYYFYGTSRDPVLLPNTDQTRLIPRYDLIHQLGTDVQFTRGAWLWKFEGSVRKGHADGETFGAFVGGFEYTLFQILDSAADLGLLTEYLYDGRDQTNSPFTAFDDDIFVGTRLALNDEKDTQALVGVVVDREDGTTLLSIEAERRLSERWKAELVSRWFFNVQKGDPLIGFRDDSFITLRLLYFL